ncbi:MAG: sigma-54 factor interaction domain-containing protein [Myxococcota bacterium]
MTVFQSAEERTVGRAIYELGRVNPFLPERRRWEQGALGKAFVPGEPIWSLGEEGDANPNQARIGEVAEALLARLLRRVDRASPDRTDREWYAGLVFMVLYNRYSPLIPSDAGTGDAEPGPGPAFADWPAYHDDFSRFFRPCPPPDPAVDTPAHLLACFWQIRRAFDTIFSSIVGGSMPSARLRAACWQSIFSFDAVRYRQFLFRVMPDVTTLITGPTGTGKELVARAIGLSGYVPFDPERRRFAHRPTLLPLNLQALPATLVESELFGHKKGSFTGATADREGWLQLCPRGGTVFLDEIGELDPMLQVKLLRVLEQRAFSAVGDSRVQRFAGKVVAATHRDLPAAIAAGTFRADLYYRLCGDRVEAPSLRERIDADPGELRRVLRALLGRWVPPDAVDEVLATVEPEILTSRGADYGWPGNVRELAQCARNVLVQGTCGPPEPGAPAAAPTDRSLAEVVSRHVRAVYDRTGSYRAAAAVLGVDWRTVKAQVDARQGPTGTESTTDEPARTRPVPSE